MAGIQANLPVFFPTETLPLGSTDDTNNDTYPDNELVVLIPSLTNVFNGTSHSVTIITPDIGSLFGNLDVIAIIRNPAILIDGFDLVLETIQDAIRLRGTR